MEQINLGTLRFMQLFDLQNKRETSIFSGYFKTFGLENIVKKVIGSINGTDPIIQINTGAPGIYTHDAMSKILTLIANDEDQLNLIVSMLKGIWKGYPNHGFLPPNHKTLAQYKLFLKELSNAPPETLNFWNGFAFKEFNINYEL